MANCENKKPCKYGSNCYRKNPEHFREFSHPQKRSTENHDEAEESKKARPDTADPAKNSPPMSSESPAPTNLQDSIQDLLPESPKCPRANLRAKFLVEMPEDFYSFMDFCKSLDPEKPADALCSCGLTVAGPCRVYLGATRGDPRFKSRRFCLTYCRHYYDPPQFQTVIEGDRTTGYHVGYWRDSPGQNAGCVVMSNSCQQDNKFAEMGDNVFAAVNQYLSERQQKAGGDSVQRVQTALQSWSRRHNFSLDTKSGALARRKLVVARTLQGCGLVVPYDKKTELGYRDLGESATSMKRMLKAIVIAGENGTEDEYARCFEPLQELITNVQFANDEGDPGTGLELGLNVFGYGGECLHKTAKNLLCVAYELLNRSAFTEILLAHLENRCKSVPPL